MAGPAAFTRAEMETRVANAINASTLSALVKTNRTAIAKVALDALMPVGQDPLTLDTSRGRAYQNAADAARCGVLDINLKPLYRFLVQ